MKANHAAWFLVEDVRNLHNKADTVPLMIVMERLLADAVNIQRTLNRLQESTVGL